MDLNKKKLILKFDGVEQIRSYIPEWSRNPLKTRDEKKKQQQQSSSQQSKTKNKEESRRLDSKQTNSKESRKSSEKKSESKQKGRENPKNHHKIKEKFTQIPIENKKSLTREQKDSRKSHHSKHDKIKSSDKSKGDKKNHSNDSTKKRTSPAKTIKQERDFEEKSGESSSKSSKKKHDEKDRKKSEKKAEETDEKRKKSPNHDSKSSESRKRSSSEREQDPNSKRKKYVTNKDITDQMTSFQRENKEFMQNMLERFMNATTRTVKEICEESIATHLINTEPKSKSKSLSIEELLAIVNAPVNEPYEYFENVNGKVVFRGFTSDCLKGSDGKKPKKRSDDLVITIDSSDEDERVVDQNKTVTSVNIKKEKQSDEQIVTKTVEIFAKDPARAAEIKQIKKEPVDETLQELATTVVKNEPIDKLTSKNTQNQPDDSKNLVNMVLINRWMGSHSKHHSFKDSLALKLMMDAKSIVSLFKCMATKCSFTSNSGEQFLNHLKSHNSSVKDYSLNCPYCFYEAKDASCLVKHYSNDHKNCIYQCSLCLYRSAEKQSLHDHKTLYHRDSNQVCIFECPRIFPSDESDEEKRAKAKVEEITLKKIVCEVCKVELTSPDELIEHLSNNHQKGEITAKVQLCLSEIKKEIANNKIGKYQCLECEFGSSKKIEMRSHLHQHPNRLHFVCLRDIAKNKLFKVIPRSDILVKRVN